MPQPLSLAQHTLFADLLEQGFEDLFDPDFPENGSFLVRERTSRAGVIRSYAYYQGYRSAAGRQDRGRRYSRYVGPTDDPAIGERIARFKRIKAVRAERSSTVDALVGAGMPRPRRAVGRMVEELARAGLFPSRAVLIGAAAYQTYSGVLGVRLSKALSAINDDGFSRTNQFAVYLKGPVPGGFSGLYGVAPSLAPAPGNKDDADAASSQSKGQFHLGFLTAHHDGDGHPPELVATPELLIAGRPAQLLDFLTDQPVRSIVLHGPGIAVTVPSPERYTVHALIVHGQQGTGVYDQVRTTSNLARATELIEALDLVGRKHALERMFAEAWEREPNWRTHLLNSLSALPEAPGTILKAQATELRARLPVPPSSRPRTPSQ
ncbi:GSU2403 family nucleotidyltransferase fold protein [Methylobacterium sp.]|uniref:GSU2403 family nucleotidyltransferase fold protein n=1 Tax=Methylobacterium sp. TaxID=409 RepID=UPI0015C8B750|nr:GSU2403 family nucleotidyltransferase fold protein [Methylobacterium sp.]